MDQRRDATDVGGMYDTSNMRSIGSVVRSASARRHAAIEADQYDAWRASFGAVRVAKVSPFLHSVSLAKFPSSLGEWPISGDDLSLAKAGAIA